MQDKEINQRNNNGERQGLYQSWWYNGIVANEDNFINNRNAGYSANYGVKGEIITNSYYAR